MFPMLSFAIAVTALCLTLAAVFLGWKLLRRLGQRMDELNQAIHVLSVSQEIAGRTLHDLEQRHPDSTAALAQLRESLASLEERFREVESYAGVCVPPKPAASGLNINRRVEAVRLLQGGSSEEEVSAELGIALSEVRLIAHLEKAGQPARPKRGRRVA